MTLAGLTMADRAAAHPGYPQKIQEVLGLAAPPPQSCNTCHVSAGGGGPLRPFGSLMVATYGLTPSMAAEDDTSLEAALAGLKLGEPALYADLESGADPNLDPALTASPRVTPQFGCAASAASAPRGAPLALALGLAALAWLRRRAR